MRHPFAGTLRLVRLVLRLDRLKLPLWLLGLGFLIAITPVSLRGIIESEAEASGTTVEQVLAQQAALLETNGATIALQGPPNSIDTFGGRYAFEIGAFTFAIVGLMNVLLVARHTRAEEESGRFEMVRASAVGLWSPIAAVSIVAVAVNTILAMLTMAVFVGDGLAVGPSLLFGVSLGLTGLIFGASALVFAQVFEYGRAATGASIAGIGVAFGLRAVGDVQGSWVALLSPIGWAQAIDPFGTGSVWLVVALVLAIAVWIVVACDLVRRRDLGGGLIQQKPGPPTAAAGLLSPLGLAWRIQRSTLFWWLVGIAALAATYGSVISSLDELVADNEAMIEALEQFGISLESLRAGFISFVLSLIALVACGGVIQSVLRARGEENAGRAESVLATGVSRQSWVGSHLLLAVLAAPLFMFAAGVALSGADAAVSGGFTDLGATLGAALLRVPALWTVTGIGALGYGLAKRLGTVGWVVFGLVAVVFMFGEVLQMPDWLIELSPISHLTHAPLETQDWRAVVIFTLVGAITAGLGIVMFRRRDLDSPA